MNEKRLVVLLTRYEADEIVRHEAHRLIEDGVDWYKVFILALNNKVIGLVYYNLIRFGLMCKIKPILYNLMKYYYLCNARRNKYIISEKKRILNELNRNGVNVLSLKGGVLLERIYKDWGSRACNDLDFYCKLENIEQLGKILKGIGYKQGEIDWNQQKIVNFSRIKKMGWKVNMNTIPTYIRKIEDNEYIDFLELDFSYSFDLRKDVSISKTVFDRSCNNEMDISDTIIYLCSHLYKEAENDIWIEAKADMNLIKFCDIREMVICLDKENVRYLVERALELNCAEAVYYCAYFLQIIYEEKMFEDLMVMFSHYGYELRETRYDKLDFSEDTRNRFWNRIFSFDNSVVLLDERFKENKRMIE